MADIRVNPETLDTQGKDLVDYAGQLEDILGAINSKINDIIDGWDGLAQDAYFDMYTNMKASLDKFPELIDALGQATSGAAKAFASVDEELQGSFSANS